MLPKSILSVFGEEFKLAASGVNNFINKCKCSVHLDR